MVPQQRPLPKNKGSRNGDDCQAHAEERVFARGKYNEEVSFVEEKL